MEEADCEIGGRGGGVLGHQFYRVDCVEGESVDDHLGEAHQDRDDDAQRKQSSGDRAVLHLLVEPQHFDGVEEVIYLDAYPQKTPEFDQFVISIYKTSKFSKNLPPARSKLKAMH